MIEVYLFNAVFISLYLYIRINPIFNISICLYISSMKHIFVYI